MRWLLFLPLSLVIGVSLFGLLIIFANNTGDADVASIGGLFAGSVGGSLSVLAGLAICPRHNGAIAAIVAFADVALAGALVYWARSSHHAGIFIASIIAGGTYSFSAVAAAVCFVKLTREERRQ